MSITRLEAAVANRSTLGYFAWHDDGFFLSSHGEFCVMGTGELADPDELPELGWLHTKAVHNMPCTCKFSPQCTQRKAAPAQP